MSKSFDISFTQTFKAVVSDGFVSQSRELLTITQTILSALPVEKRTKEQNKALTVTERFLAMDDETFAEAYLKQAMRDGYRDEVIEVLKNGSGSGLLDFSKFAPALVTVTSREK